MVVVGLQLLRMVCISFVYLGLLVYCTQFFFYFWQPDVPPMNQGTEITTDMSPAPENQVITSDTFAALNKNPISALMEFAQARKMTATIEVIGQRGPSHNPK